MVEKIDDGQVPEWMKPPEDEFSIGFADPSIEIPKHAVSTNEGVNYDGIQRWEVTEERNGVIGMRENRRGARMVPSEPKTNVVDSLRQITQSKTADVPKENFVLIVKGKMAASGTAEEIVANVLQIIHNSQDISDEDIIIMHKIELNDFFNIPIVKELLARVARKDY